MKRAPKQMSDEMREEYDFASMTGGVRGKYSARLAEDTNIVVLEDDVASAFGTDEAVNEALRAVLKAAAVVERARGASANTPLPSTAVSRG